MNRRHLLTIGAGFTTGCSSLKGLTSGGSSCVGPHCRPSSAAPGSIQVAIDLTTTFQSSIAASADNFFSRLSGTSPDLILSGQVDDFFEPARRVIAAHLLSPTRCHWKATNPPGRLKLEIEQIDWQTAAKSETSLKIPSYLSTEHWATARWKGKAVVDIYVVQNRIMYKGTLEVSTEVKESPNSSSWRPASPTPDSVAQFADSILYSLRMAYGQLVRQRFGIEVPFTTLKELVYSEVELR